MKVQAEIRNVDSVGRMVLLTAHNDTVVIFTQSQVDASLRGRLFHDGEVVTLEREEGQRRMSDWRIIG